MTAKGTLPGRKTTTHKAVATSAGSDMARSARLEELRRMVASGRYKVEPYKLAVKIMVKALGRHE